MRERIRFTVPGTNDIISKSGNAGKLGIRIDNKLSKQMPDFVKQGDFPKSFSVKSRAYKGKGTGSFLSRTKFEQTKHKETQIDIAGFEAGKVDDYNFRGKGALRYNPFANAAGEISQTGGYNAGGDEDYKNKKDKDVIINPRFKLGRRNRSSHLPQQIRNPDPFPSVLDPDKEVRKPGGFVIRSQQSQPYR